jgi:glycosyltransferase involved in cell wall biosynthesis
VLAPAPIGGLERVVEALAAGQRRRGDRVSVALVVGIDEPDPPLAAALAARGVEPVLLRIPPRGYLRERALLRGLLRRVRPDVLHTHGYRPDVLLSGVARGEGIPVVTTVHGFTGGDWKNRLYERLQCRAFRRFDAVVAVSGRLAEQLAAAGVPRNVIHSLPNAWGETSAPLPRPAARAALGLPEAGFLVGWVGRVSREKGLDVAIEALSHAGRAGETDLRLVVAGEGAERAALQARSASLGLEDRIRWLGAVADAGRYFAAFDAFLISSRTEGTPVVLFEAMAAGVPVVATRVGGIPAVVSDSEALLVPPESPEALAAALSALRRDPGAARERALSAGARLRAEHGLEPWIDRYSEVYRQALMSSRSPV